MKQKHINILRAAANTLQSSIIQDELTAELKKEWQKAAAKSDTKKCDAIDNMLSFSRNRNKEFLKQYADLIQQFRDQPFTDLIEKIESGNELNPLFANILSKHFN